jgi:phage minor structural protein
MVYPIDGAHFDDLTYSSIIKVLPSDGANEQLFRVYKISRPLNGKVAISAEHISYQLSFIPVSPFAASNCAGALSGLVSHSMETNPFTVWTDKETSATYKQTLPASFRSQLGGVQGSILDVYGGEYEFDNYTVKLHASRGADNGVTLRYGKNITDIKQEENISNTITGIVPYWTDSEGNTVTGDAQYSENADNFPFMRTAIKDFSQEFEDAPTKAALEQYTRNYIECNDIGIPSVSIDVSFVALWQTEEYKDIANLERVKLCDTVTVEFEKLGISAKAKVIRTEFDVLKEKYNKIEIGEVKANLVNTLSDIQQTAKESASTSFMQQAIAHASSLISGGLGGHVVINRNANGEPNEILIMDTDDKDTAVNVIRMNVNGIGFSTTGYDGDYTTAWTIDGHFNADFIKAGTINAIDITGSHITGVLMEGSTARFGRGNLQTTLSYGPSIGFDGHDALIISGNDRIAIESTHQVRMTGASVHVGTENDDTEAFIYIGPSGSGNGIQMSGNVMVRDGRLLGYAGTIGTEELKLMAYESGGRKYVAVYQDGSYFGNIQLS